MNRSMILPPAFLLSLVTACGSSSSEENGAAYDACIATETKSLARPGATVEAPKGPFSTTLLEAEPAQVAAIVRQDLKANMRASLENARASRIARARCAHLRPDPSVAGFADAGALPSAADGNGAKQASGTNNQVAGVDEADFVKNDNEYIYVANGPRFRIIEAWPATTAREIANVTVPGEAKKLFVEGNRALVYSATPRAESQSAGPQYSAYPKECTYGQTGCVPSDDGTETEISIFDITDRAAPKLVRSIHSSSSLIAARRIGHTVHTVLGQSSIAERIGWATSVPNVTDETPEPQISAAYDALIAQNEAKLDTIDVGNVLPTWTDSVGRTPDVSLYRSSMPDGTALTSVLSLDLVADPALKIASVISRSGWIYASANALYMAVPHQQISGWGWFDGQSESELSTIHKFSIGTSTAATSYLGTGVVKGRVLNSDFAPSRGAAHLSSTA